MKNFKFWILIFTIWFLCIQVYGYMVLNDTYDGFPEPEKSQISNMIVLGASNFLDSNSDVSLLLKEYEIQANSPFNFSSALSRTESALKKLEDSRKNYMEALNIGEKCEYEQLYKEKLKNFDYNGCILEDNLNIEIANEVSLYLKKADVIGLYRRNIEKLDEIIVILKEMKNSFDNSIKPDISGFWSLLQEYSETTLFGNYATVLSFKAFNDQ